MTSESFSLVTWNLALGGPSNQAPASVDSQTNLFAILDEIDRHDPDFICLQEMPTQGFVHYLSDRYVSGQVVPSHSGFSAVFVRRGPIANHEIQLDSQLSLPPATGVSLQIGEEQLLIFSLHLFPTKANAPQRLQFLSSFLPQVRASQPLLIAGDFNMREVETEAVTALGLRDAYQQWDDPDRKLYATWDSIVNLFHDNRYPFRARYDRVFYRNLQLQDYQLLGRTPIELAGSSYYLSDHFGIYAEFSFETE